MVHFLFYSRALAQTSRAGIVYYSNMSKSHKAQKKSLLNDEDEPQPTKKSLLDDDDGADAALPINSEFAAQYERKKRREALSKCTCGSHGLRERFSLVLQHILCSEIIFPYICIILFP